MSGTNICFYKSRARARASVPSPSSARVISETTNNKSVDEPRFRFHSIEVEEQRMCLVITVIYFPNLRLAKILKIAVDTTRHTLNISRRGDAMAKSI